MTEGQSAMNREYKITLACVWRFVHVKSVLAKIFN